MRKNNLLPVIMFIWTVILNISCFVPEATAQDRIPACPPLGKTLKKIKPLREMTWANDTISAQIFFPTAFRETGRNEIIDSIALLSPVFEHLRQLRAGLSEDTVRIVHIGDSHVRGHIYPQTTGTRLTETFGAVSYIDKGVNGATCLTFTHPDRIAEIAALKPELLILSFGTNESHNRRYNMNVHYNQMDELDKWTEHAKEVLDFWPIAYYPFQMIKTESGAGLEDLCPEEEIKKDWEIVRGKVKEENANGYPMFMEYMELIVLQVIHLLRLLSLEKEQQKMCALRKMNQY